MQFHKQTMPKTPSKFQGKENQTNEFNQINNNNFNNNNKQSKIMRKIFFFFFFCQQNNFFFLINLFEKNHSIAAIPISNESSSIGKQK